jgi:Fe2+/Zn2+ uptake regulation proteins
MNETMVFQQLIENKGLKHSKPRMGILDVFLTIEKHVSIDELWVAVKKKHPSVGYATVYRTLKLLCEGGLCRELHFEDGTTRYEHLYGHNHHDHLICTECGQLVEVVDGKIEELQVKLMKRYGFSPKYHRMDLYGTCKNCRK